MAINALSCEFVDTFHNLKLHGVDHRALQEDCYPPLVFGHQHDMLDEPRRMPEAPQLEVGIWPGTDGFRREIMDPLVVEASLTALQIIPT